MSNNPNSLQISVQEVAEKLKSMDPFFLLDVRELEEVAQVRLVDSRVHVVPLSRLSAEGLTALPPALQDKNSEIIIFCHMGSRSFQVAVWLSRRGWKSVRDMTGGIDAYARQVDPSVGFYN